MCMASEVGGAKITGINDVMARMAGLDELVHGELVIFKPALFKDYTKCR